VKNKTVHFLYVPMEIWN